MEYIFIFFPLGVLLAFKLWPLDREFDNRGIHFYSLYYFHSAKHENYKSIADTELQYTIYKEVYKGKSTYYNYVQAVSNYYESASESVKKALSHAAYVYFKQWTLIGAAGVAISTVVGISFSAGLGFYLGFCNYLLFRVVLFMFFFATKIFAYKTS